MKKQIVDFFRRWGLSVFSVIFGSIIILLLLLMFNTSTNKTMEQFIHSNMEEMNQAAIVALNKSFDNFIEPLQLQADLFDKIENPSDQKIILELQRYAERSGLKNAAIVTFDGKVYSSVRGITSIQKGEKMPNLLKRETSISQPRLFYDGALVIDISTPVYLDKKEVGKLVVSVDSDYIAGMFSDNILKGDAALNLLTSDGVLIARISRRLSPLRANSNVFDFYNRDDVTFKKSSVEVLANSMRNHQEAWVKYIYEGSNMCVSYMPFGLNDWYLAIAATDNTLNEQSGIIRNNALMLTAGIMFIVITASFIVVVQRIREQRRIDALKNTYSIAIKKTNDLFYEADIDNDLFIDYSEQKDKAIWKETPKNYSNALIQMADVCAPECKQQFLDTFLPQNIKIKMKEGLSSINFEYKITPDENTVRWLSATFVPIDNGLGGTRLICMENDITEHMLRQESLKRSSTLDGLTGIYNRETVRNYVNWFFEGEGQDGEHALALIDIDYFKEINDKLGHFKGDMVLTEFAQALKKIFRKSDLVGRVGGDEFVVLIKDYSVVELVMAKMNAVLENFNKEQYLADDVDVVVNTSASIGISIYNKDGTDFDALYQAADFALYESKHRGRNQYTFYSADMKNPVDTKGDQ